MAFTRILSIVAAAFVAVGGILAVTALFAGPWVEAKAAAASDSSGSATAAVSLAPGGICTTATRSGAGNAASSACFVPSQIEAKWTEIAVVIESPNPNNKLPATTTGAGTAAMLGNVYNLVAAGAVGCAACLVLYLPFLIREVRGGVAIVKCCGKWTAIIGGAAAAAGGVLVLTAYGVVADSDLAKDVVKWWNLGTVTSGGSSASLTAGFSPVMDCAAAAGAFAIVGALLIIARGTVCIGDDDDDDGIGEPITKANPFHDV